MDISKGSRFSVIYDTLIYDTDQYLFSEIRLCNEFIYVT